MKHEGCLETPHIKSLYLFSRPLVYPVRRVRITAILLSSTWMIGSQHHCSARGLRWSPYLPAEGWRSPTRPHSFIHAAEGKLQAVLNTSAAAAADVGDPSWLQNELFDPHTLTKLSASTQSTCGSQCEPKITHLQPTNGRLADQRGLNICFCLPASPLPPAPAQLVSKPQ